MNVALIAKFPSAWNISYQDTFKKLDRYGGVAIVDCDDCNNFDAYSLLKSVDWSTIIVPGVSFILTLNPVIKESIFAM